MGLEPQHFQSRVRSYLNWVGAGAIKGLGGFVERMNGKLLIGVCGVPVVCLYVHMYYMLPWNLWRHMVKDTLCFLLVPFLLVCLSKSLQDIGDFLFYQHLKTYCFHDYVEDVHLHVWKARKYYKYVKITSMHFVAAGYNVYEDSSEDDSSEAPKKEAIEPEA